MTYRSGKRLIYCFCGIVYTDGAVKGGVVSDFEGDLSHPSFEFLLLWIVIMRGFVY